MLSERRTSAVRISVRISTGHSVPMPSPSLQQLPIPARRYPQGPLWTRLSNGQPRACRVTARPGAQRALSDGPSWAGGGLFVAPSQGARSGRRCQRSSAVSQLDSADGLAPYRSDSSAKMRTTSAASRMCAKRSSISAEAERRHLAGPFPCSSGSRQNQRHSSRRCPEHGTHSAF